MTNWAGPRSQVVVYFCSPLNRVALRVHFRDDKASANWILLMLDSLII